LSYKRFKCGPPNFYGGKGRLEVGTENLKRDVVSILLVFGSVFSMISVVPFASSGDLIYDPGGENIYYWRGYNDRTFWKYEP